MLAWLSVVGLSVMIAGGSDGTTVPEASEPGHAFDCLAGIGTRADLGVCRTEESAALEDAVRACMNAAGLDYMPVVFEYPGAEMTAQEWAESYGLGLLGMADIDIPDPNEPMLESMSEDDRTAWDAQRAACNAEHDLAVPNAVSALAEEFTTAVDGDARMIEAVEAWSACMSEAGFDYESPNAMMNQFINAIVALNESASADSGTDPTDDDWAELTELEHAVALANVECSVDYDVVHQTVMQDLRPDFLDQYLTLVTGGTDPTVGDG